MKKPTFKKVFDVVDYLLYEFIKDKNVSFDEKKFTELKRIAQQAIGSSKDAPVNKLKLRWFTEE